MKVRDLLPPRPDDMHKGHRGRLLIVGGSERYPGAPALSALGALRSGAGVVTLLSLQKVCEACASRLPEVVYCYEDDKFRWKELAMAQKKIDAVVIGPGLDRSVATELVTSRMWREWPTKILVDGDGLNALAAVQKDLTARKDSVITPHEGEAARLLETTPDEIRADRFYAVSELSAKWGCAVLKGHHTLIASGEKFLEIKYGNPALSVPGSGDVLSGCIGAFLGMGLEPFDAAVLGATVHGMAGDYLAREGVDGVLASEIADAIRKIINALRNSKNDNNQNQTK
ncbi:MAG: NAD(P)H-hydrate dehydratase [Synergistaceae bacterium]|nr:NAD(P)H-hydrate dehydratase [Synergistaceae bacterium]